MIVSGTGDDIDLVKSLSSGSAKHSDELHNESTGDGDSSFHGGKERENEERREKKIKNKFTQGRREKVFSSLAPRGLSLEDEKSSNFL